MSHLLTILILVWDFENFRVGFEDSLINVQREEVKEISDLQSLSFSNLFMKDSRKRRRSRYDPVHPMLLFLYFYFTWIET